jgi:DNA-binding NarL/FixJ family response regulator
MNKATPTNAYKILLIDDDIGITRLITMMLEKSGYNVSVAHSGHDGIGLVKQEMPDLILCDVMMPIMDGYGVLKELQSSSDTATIPFIFLTARASQEHVREGMELGADDYVTKPVKTDALLTAVNSRLRRHQAIQAGRLATFAQRLVLSQEHYRQQMAYLLESDINQSLRSLQFILNMLDAPSDTALYSQVKTQMEELIRRVEGMTQEMHPTMLGRLGLLPAIRWLIEQYELVIDLEVENLDYKFDPQVEVCLFRLIQESLNNVAQHSKTDQATVMLKYAEPYIELRITDQGVGFDLEKTLQSHHSMGIQRMYGLVDWLRGEMNIASWENEGVSIYVMLPQTAVTTAARQSVSRQFLQLASRPQQTGKSPAAPATQDAIRIMLVMEQPLQLQGLKKLLNGNSQFLVMGEARNLREAVRVMETKKPQLLIVDPVVQNKNQMDILQTLTTANPETAVLVISPSTHSEYIRAAFNSGALGYIPNTATITDMHTAIMRVAQKQYYASPALNFNLEEWQQTQKQA